MVRQLNQLTAREVKTAATGKYSDGGGLILIKTSVQTGNWLYRYSLAGKRREMGLGSIGEVSLSDARRQRDRWAALLREGNDPISIRDQQRAHARLEMAKKAPTFEETALKVFEAKKAGLRGDGKRGRWFSPLKLHVIPKIGNMPITEIHQTDIERAIRPIWKTKHETADKALARTRIIFHHARLSGLDVDTFTVDAARHMLGEVDIKVKPIPATPWQDIPSLYARLDNGYASSQALRFIILTIARSTPALGARFDEIKGEVWTVPASRMKGHKNKVSEFRIPLSPAAMQIVDECRTANDTPFLFPNQRMGFISSQAIHKKLKKLGVDGRPHGFRTSFRTWVQDTNSATYDVAETALGHQIGNKVERAYARSDLLDQRQILANKWAEFATNSSAKIVKLHRS